MSRNRKKAEEERIIYLHFGQQRTTEFKHRFCDSSPLALATRLENHREEVLEELHFPHCLWNECHTFGSLRKQI